jgi:predicted GIY-YIG superfamily endonuclease
MATNAASKKNRGKLVRSFREHIFRENIERNEIPEMPGAYALYNEYGLCYIGISKNLRTRIGNHLKSKHKKWTNCSWYEIPKMKYIKDLETALVRITHARYNKQIPKFGKAKKLITFLGFILFSNIVISQIKYAVIETNYVSFAINGENVDPESHKECKFTLKYVNGGLIAVVWDTEDGNGILYDHISFHDRKDNRISYSAIDNNTGSKVAISIRNDSTPLKIVISSYFVYDGKDVFGSEVFYKEKE